MTDNLVWVVDPETHPGASRHPSDGGDFQRSHPCRFAAPASCLLSGCHMQSESGWLSDSIGGGAYNPLLGLPAALTRLPPESGQPFYGWLAQPANLWTARFSGLQGPNSTYNS